MSIWNYTYTLIDFDFVGLLASLRRFFVYPDPKGSESIYLRQLGTGVNKWIFKRYRMN